MRYVNIELINNMANQNCHFKLKTSIQWLYYQTSLCVCMITVNIKAALKQNCLESIKMMYTPLTGFCQREVLSYNQLETRPEIKKTQAMVHTMMLPNSNLGPSFILRSIYSPTTVLRIILKRTVFYLYDKI